MASKPTFLGLVAKLRELKTLKVKVGVLGDAGASPDGTPLAEIAAVHEFGTSPSSKIQIPQRSFIRSTFRRTTSDRQKLTERLLKGVLNGKLSAEQALELLGQWSVGQIKDTIVKRMTEGPDPQELKPETIARKGSSTPLIDTGLMRNSITYALVKETK